MKCIRLKAMTASAIIAAALPILWSHGMGADVMKRITTPLIGVVVTSSVMALVIYPANFYLWRSRRFKTLPASKTASEILEERKESV